MNQKYNIKIHVGYPKTGTTTLQKHFFPKIKDIEYIGIFFNDNDEEAFQYSFGTIDNLIFSSKDSIEYQKNLEEFKKSLSSNKNNVLSQEGFLFRCLITTVIDGKRITPKPLDVARNLRNFFSEEEFNVEILFTVRKQDEMITSLYAQAYSPHYFINKDTETFQKFLDIYLNKNKNTHTFFTTLDYFKTINEYISVFSRENVSVLVFEELEKKPKIFYENLCDFLEIDKLKYSEIALTKVENKRSTQKKYKRISSSTMLDKLYGIKQKYLPFIKIPISSSMKEKLNNIVLSNNNISKTIYLSESQKKQVLDIYKNRNQKLSKEFNLDLEKYGY